MSVVKITNYRPYEKGSLRAFFTATLASGLVIHGLRLFAKDAGNRWIGLPSEKFIDKNGAEGYRPIVEFTSRKTCEDFRKAMLEAIDGLHQSATAKYGKTPHGDENRQRETRGPGNAVKPDDPDFEFPF